MKFIRLYFITVFALLSISFVSAQNKDVQVEQESVTDEAISPSEKSLKRKVACI